MATENKTDHPFDPYDISKDDEFMKEEKKSRSAKHRRSNLSNTITKECMIQKQEITPGQKFSDGNDLFVVTEKGEFLCATCPRAFKSLVGRQRHMNKCATEIVMDSSPCPCCGETTENAHKVGDMVCPECFGKFLNEESLDKHMTAVHRGAETFGCAVCPLRFLTKAQLVIHLYAHSDQKPWMCKTCNAVFTRKYHLERHFRQSGCDGQPRTSNSCQVCGREFTRKDNLREHLRAHAGMNKRLTIYTCEFCGMDIAGLHNYNVHKKENHVGDKPYKCSYCPMHFRVSGAMKKHMRKHTGEKPYECSECFKKFAAKETLNRHMKTHTNVRDFVCKICGKGFIQGSQLRAHVFHHTGEFGYECDKCHRKFNRKIRLTTHIKYDHNSEEPYSCDMCHKKFLVKSELEKHIIVHSKEKNFKCSICSKEFAQKPYLKIHLLTHNKEAPRACNYCNRAFIRQDCLLRHMRSKHRDKLERILIEAERKKLQLQLLTITTKEEAVTCKESPETLATALPGAISDLLTSLMDDETLQSFGFSSKPIDEVLQMVINGCGQNAVVDPTLSVLDRLRENVKLLFTAVIDDAGVKALLNNQSVDEVISHVLNLIKS